MAVDDVVIFPIKVATNGAGYASKMNIEGVMLLCKKITAENKRSRDRAEKTKFFTALTPFTPFAAVSYPYKKKGQLNN